MDDKLPPELQQMIACYLDIKSVVQLMLVSRDCYKLVTTLPGWSATLRRMRTALMEGPNQQQPCWFRHHFHHCGECSRWEGTRGACMNTLCHKICGASSLAFHFPLQHQPILIQTSNMWSNCGLSHGITYIQCCGDTSNI